jgi:stress response protein YsnF
VTTRTDLVEEHVRESLQSDDVEVMRVPVNRTLDPGEAAPTIRSEGNVTIIPVLEEVVVVEKRLVLKEELHILRETATEEVEVPVTLRKQRADIQRTGPDGLSTSNEE